MRFSHGVGRFRSAYGERVQLLFLSDVRVVAVGWIQEVPGKRESPYRTKKSEPQRTQRTQRFIRVFSVSSPSSAVHFLLKSINLEKKSPNKPRPLRQPLTVQGSRKANGGKEIVYSELTLSVNSLAL